MAKWTAEILSSWTTDPDGQRSVKVTRDFAGINMSDTTGQENVIPDPNLMICRITCEAAVLEAIEAGGYQIMWAEEVPEEVV